MKKSYIDRNKEDISLAPNTTDILKNLLKERLNLTDQEIESYIKEKSEIFLPVSIFGSKLSTLEIIVKYLKENLKLKNHQIAKKLNRTEKTIWSAYKRSLVKSSVFEVKSSEVVIPLSIFSVRLFSPLESLVSHLRSKDLSFSRIASLLNLSYKTIYTIHARYKKKK